MEKVKRQWTRIKRETGAGMQEALKQRQNSRTTKRQSKKDSKSREAEEKIRRREGIVSEWLWDGEAVALGRVRGSDAYAKRREQISAARANQTPVLPGALLDRQRKHTSTCTHTHTCRYYEALKGILESLYCCTLEQTSIVRTHNGELARASWTLTQNVHTHTHTHTHTRTHKQVSW